MSMSKCSKTFASAARRRLLSLVENGELTFDNLLRPLESEAGSPQQP
jgi:hypothetical protein